MHESWHNGHQIVSDGRTVWVNGPDGGMVGRFGLAGIDIHRSLADQMEKGECLFCTHTMTTADDWQLFIDKIRELFNVEIDDELHRPQRCDAPAG